ncbi:S8 family serine peptidase [Brevibacillus dissolubilis]|uniref:S8 family serine peptidase n=1 Tax=Brevibacillus dissolubilis TaxID=1844116 RepID=UPI0011160E41|nr:S8 family serine peptidase [Brevibacillus dissolubilis]
MRKPIKRLLIPLLSMVMATVPVWGSPSYSYARNQSPTTAATEQTASELLVVWNHKHKTSPYRTAAARPFTINHITAQEKRLAPDVSLIKARSAEEAQLLQDALQADPGVESVEPNQLLQLQLPDRSEAALRRAMQADGERPDDPMFDQQWIFPFLHVTEAWGLLPPPSEHEVKVAVIDSGVEMTHPDLLPILLPGKDYVDNDAYPLDLLGHGTHVSGILAAKSQNREGISGLTGSTPVKIIPLRILDAKGFGSVSSEVQAIYDAVNMGADIINLSLGADSYSQAEARAVRHAIEQGVIVVAATGNEGGDVCYPAALPNVIGVGASTRRDSISWFSNYGREVDVIAPGEDILSTVPFDVNETGYEYSSGTSMATPVVSALVALMRAQDPQITTEEVTDILRTTSVDLGIKGRDRYAGYGRIDYRAALLRFYENRTSANETYTMKALRQDPSHLRELFTDYKSNDIFVKAADGSLYTWAELLKLTSRLSDLLDDDKTTLSVAPDHTAEGGFIQSVTPDWQTTVSDPNPMIEVTLDVPLTSAHLSKYMKVIDSKGKRLAGIRFKRVSSTNTFTVQSNRPFLMNETYHLLYMDTLPIVQFTVTEKTSSFPVSQARVEFTSLPVQTDIPLDKTFEVGFSKPMQAGSVNSSTVWLEDAQGTEIPVTLTLLADQRRATVDPIQDLLPGQTYYLKVSDSTQSVKGVRLKQAVVLLFHTRSSS